MKNDARAEFTLLDLLIALLISGIVAMVTLPILFHPVEPAWEARLDDGRVVTCGRYEAIKCGVNLWDCSGNHEKHLCQKSVSLTRKTKERSVER